MQRRFLSPCSNEASLKFPSVLPLFTFQATDLRGDSMQLHSNPSTPVNALRTALPDDDQESFAALALTQLLNRAAEADKTAAERKKDTPPAVQRSSGNSWASQANENRKAAAAQKVARLKDLVKALKQMMLLATPDDAAAMARRLKQIAGQLKSAVAQYAQAGGSSSGGSTGGSTGSISAPAATGSNTEAGDTQSIAATQAVTQSPANSQITQARQAVQTSQADTATSTADSSGTENTPQRTTDSGASGADRGSREQDEKFLADVNYIRNALKQMARLAARKMREGDPARQDLKQLMKDLQAVDKLANDIRSGQSTDMLATRVSNVQAAYSANLTTGTVGAVQVNIAAPVVNVAI